MAHPTDRTIPAQRRELDDLIAAGLAASGILPTIDECRRLNTDLRAAIGDLADTVRRDQDRLPEASPDWQVREQALLGAQAALCGDLGRGLRSAALHVATLAEQARALAGCIPVD